MTLRRRGWAAIASAVFIIVSFVSVRRLALLHGVAQPPAGVVHTPGTAPQGLLAPGSIAGHVRGPTGQTVGKANVCATTLSSDVYWAPDTTCTTTDSTGQYLIAPLTKSTYVVSAVASGFQPASALQGGNVSLQPGEAKTGIDASLLADGVKLSGVVLDAAGGPISGATISALRRDPPHDVAVANSGSDGRFVIWSGPGAVTVLAEARSFAPLRLLHVAPSSDLVLTLTPGSTIRGRVVTDGNGTPASGVEVRAVKAGGWNHPNTRFGMSDAEGLFEISGLEPNQYTLAAVGVGRYGELRNPIPVGLGSHTDGLTVVVSPVATVTGKVIRRGSNESCSRGTVSLGPEPAARSSAGVGSARASVPALFTHLEADGSVHFNAVPAGVYHVELNCEESLLAEGPTSLQVAATDLGGIVWKVDPAVHLVVHALNEVNQRAAHSQLRLFGPVLGGADPASALFHSALTTNAEGIAEVRGLWPGVYRLEPERGYHGATVNVDARVPGRVDATTHLAGHGSIVLTVQAADGSRIDQVSVAAVLEEQPTAPSTLSRNADKEPALDRDPQHRGAPGTALGNGQFQIGPLALGSYRVFVNDGFNPPAEPTDHPRGLVHLNRDIARATVILRRSGQINGRVLDSSGTPSPYVWVSANCRFHEASSAPSSSPPGEPASSGRFGPFGRLPARRAVTDTAGRFRIDGLDSSAACLVRAEQPGGSVGITRNVRPGDETTVVLPALGTLSGDAAFPDGSPVTGFALSVRDPETGTRNERVVKTAAGRWSVPRVVPGRLQLFASATGAVAQANLDLSPGQARDGIQLQFRSLPVQSTTH
jgi:hypothetical protein